MKRLLLVAVLATLGGLVGCSDAIFPYLTAIAVNPGTSSVAAGRTQQFTAQGTFSNGATKDITSLVTWTSSTAPVGTVNSAGLAQSYSQGTSTITATFTGPAAGTVTGTGTLTVTAPALVAVVVTDGTTVIPGSRTSLVTARIANGTGRQFLAYGIYSDGGERPLPNNITTSVTWASTPAAVATITTTGRATSVSAGTATITATDPTTTLSATTSLVVTNAGILGIEVYPVGGQTAGLTMASNTRQQFLARGVFSDNTQQDITLESTWTSTTPAAATVSNVTPKGLVTGVALGTTQIQATFSGTTGAAPLGVTAASLTAITLTPGTSGVAVGSVLPISAVGTFSDTSKQPINLAVAWSVTPADNSIAKVDATGLVTGVAAGSATVTAQFGTIKTNATINVQTLKSVAVGSVVPIVNPSYSQRRTRDRVAVYRDGDSRGWDHSGHLGLCHVGRDLASSGVVDGASRDSFRFARVIGMGNGQRSRDSHHRSDIRRPGRSVEHNHDQRNAEDTWDHTDWRCARCSR